MAKLSLLASSPLIISVLALAVSAGQFVREATSAHESRAGEARMTLLLGLHDLDLVERFVGRDSKRLLRCDLGDDVDRKHEEDLLRIYSDEIARSITRLPQSSGWDLGLAEYDITELNIEFRSYEGVVLALYGRAPDASQRESCEIHLANLALAVRKTAKDLAVVGRLTPDLPLRTWDDAPRTMIDALDGDQWWAKIALADL